MERRRERKEAMRGKERRWLLWVCSCRCLFSSSFINVLVGLFVVYKGEGGGGGGAYSQGEGGRGGGGEEEGSGFSSAALLSMQMPCKNVCVVFLSLVSLRRRRVCTRTIWRFFPLFFSLALFRFLFVCVCMRVFSLSLFSLSARCCLGLACMGVYSNSNLNRCDKKMDRKGTRDYKLRCCCCCCFEYDRKTKAALLSCCGCILTGNASHYSCMLFSDCFHAGGREIMVLLNKKRLYQLLQCVN